MNIDNIALEVRNEIHKRTGYPIHDEAAKQFARHLLARLESEPPVAWMFVPILKNPRVETAVFTTSAELARQWAYNGCDDLGHGTVTALGAIK